MKDKQQRIFDQLNFLGRFVANVVLSNSDIELQLTNSFVKQVLISISLKSVCFGATFFIMTWLEIPFFKKMFSLND